MHVIVDAEVGDVEICLDDGPGILSAMRPMLILSIRLSTLWSMLLNGIHSCAVVFMYPKFPRVTIVWFVCTLVFHNVVWYELEDEALIEFANWRDCPVYAVPSAGLETCRDSNSEAERALGDPEGITIVDPFRTVPERIDVTAWKIEV